MSQALANALAAMDESIGSQADERQQIVLAKCRGLMMGYDARWQSVRFDIVAVETLVQADLYNPETQRRSRSFSIAGKLDVLALVNGRRVLIDHKTTSQDITDPNAPYWRQLQIEGQVNHYMLLEWQNERKVESALWDVIRKPLISPKKLSKAERASIVAEGRYFGYSATHDERMAFSRGEERETLPMYTARLANDCTVEKPEWYFQRRAVPRLDSEIVAYAQDLWEHGQDMLHERNKNRLPPANSGACMLYGSPCKYLGVCSGHDSIDSERWQTKANVHNELPMIEGDGRDVLTNSRIRCFQTCRRKHHYDYELGVERYDEEEKESLFFGSLIHVGLEAWFGTFMKDSENGNSNESRVIETGISAASDQSQLAFRD